MKFQEYKLDEWDGSFEEVFKHENERVLLLHLTNLSGLKDEGRRNLIKVDEKDNIIWVAEAPRTGRIFSWFVKFKFEDDRYIAWYSGNVIVEIDPRSGKLINEQFIR